MSRSSRAIGATAKSAETATHQRSIHIDAPIEQVFDYLKDPHTTYAVISETPTSRIDRHVKPKLTNATMTPGGGVGTTWSFTARLLLFHIDATYTREEYVPNKRIVDRNPDAQCGVAFGFEPDATGTTLTMAWLDSSRVPLLTKVWDRIYWDGEHDLDAMLSSVKNAVETGHA